MRLDLVGYGGPIMDILYTENGVLERPGGSSATVVATASKLGIKCGLIGRAGDDDCSRRLLAELDAAGVDLRRLRANGKTAKNHIKVTPEEREIFRAEDYSALLPDERDMEYTGNAEALYCRAASGQFPRFVEFCEDAGVRVFTSLQRFVPDDSYDEKALYSPAVKIIFCNEKEAKESTIEIRDQMIVVTRGSRGCSVYYKDKAEHFAPYCVTAIDPTGAGDVFAGTFIAGYMRGLPLSRIAEGANKMAAISTTMYGARTFIMSLNRDLYV